MLRSQQKTNACFKFSKRKILQGQRKQTSITSGLWDMYSTQTEGLLKIKL